MASEKNSTCFVQQFRPNMKMLVVCDNATTSEWPTKLSISEIFNENDIDESFKLTSLNVILDLICRFCKLYADIPSVREIWTPHLCVIQTLKVILFF